MKKWMLSLSLFAGLTWLAPAQPARPFSETLPAFETMCRQLFEHSGVPGLCVGIVYRGQVVYLKGFGVRQAGGSEAVDADTVFQLASCSKPMTSTALAHLVSRRRIGWDDKIVSHLPDFQVSDPWITQHLTFRDLLSHHSGLPEFAGDVLDNLGMSQQQVLHQLRLLKTDYDFRAGYAYTNFGYTAAAQAAARADGKPFDQMMQAELFGPLGMTSASVRFADYQAAPNHASSHLMQSGKPKVTLRNPDHQAPAGGVSCSTRDFLRWAQFHLDPKQTIVPRPILAETYRVHSVTADNPANFSASGFYGLGWIPAFDSKGRLKLSHSGAFFQGVRSCVTLLPQEEVGIVVVCNAFPSALPEAISAGFLKLYDGGQCDPVFSQTVADKVLAVLQKMSAALPVPPLAPGLPGPSATGVYANEFYGEARIFRRDDQSWLALGSQEFPLQVTGPNQLCSPDQPGKYEDIHSFLLNFDRRGFVLQGLGPEQFSRFERL